MSDVYLCDLQGVRHKLLRGSDAATHIPGCAEPMPGRWVAWCVAHGSRLNDDDTCDSAHFHSDICVEHPLGAFIPEVDDDA